MHNQNANFEVFKSVKKISDKLKLTKYSIIHKKNLPCNANIQLSLSPIIPKFFFYS